MINKDKSEFQKNREKLKQCKLIDNILVFAYLIPCLVTAGFSLLRMFIFGFESIILLIFGVAANVAVFFLGFWGVYRKKIIFSALSPVVAVVSSLICMLLDAVLKTPLMLISTGSVGKFNFITALITALLIFLNIENTRSFEHLKQQPGYPYFNDLIEKQKEEHQKNSIKTEYESTYERITQNKVIRGEDNVYTYEKSSTQPATMDEI